MMVALAVLVILAVVAYPDLRAVVRANQLTAAANESLAMLQSARMEAIRRNARAAACLSANPNAASPSCSANGARGWIVFMDSDKDFTFDAGEPLVRVTSLPADVQILGSSNFAGVASFRSDGLARTKSGALLRATVDMCMPVSEPGDNVRHISIGTGSRISITKASTSKSCANPENEP